MARTQHFKVGLFVIAATALLVGTIALVAGIQFAEPRDHYTVRFEESVSGLEAGSPVKYRGVRVGTVEDLEIPADDITKVEVEIGVKEGTPVRTDTKARLRSVGITGLMYVELYGGTAGAKPLAVGGRIESEVSLLESLSGRAESAAEKADMLLDNMLDVTNHKELERLKARLAALHASVMENSEQLNDLLVISTSAMTHMDTILVRSSGILERNQSSIERSLADLEGGLHEMRLVLTKLNEGEVIDNLSVAAEAGRDVMSDVRTLVGSNRRTIAETLANLRETSANMSEFSRLVRDKPSLLIRSNAPERRRLPDAD